MPRFFNNLTPKAFENTWTMSPDSRFWSSKDASRFHSGPTWCWCRRTHLRNLKSPERPASKNVSRYGLIVAIHRRVGVGLIIGGSNGSPARGFAVEAKVMGKDARFQGDCATRRFIWIVNWWWCRGKCNKIVYRFRTVFMDRRLRNGLHVSPSLGLMNDAWKMGFFAKNTVCSDLLLNFYSLFSAKQTLYSMVF